MNKNMSYGEENQKLIQKIKNLFPENEKSILSSKSGISSPNSNINEDTIITTNESIEDSKSILKKDNHSSFNNFSISLKEELEEKEVKKENYLDCKAYIKKNKNKKGRNNKLYNNLCGKKRKRNDKSSIKEDNNENINNFESKENQNKINNSYIEKKKMNPSQKKIINGSKKIIDYKNILLNLARKEGYLKVFNCLNIIKLNRKNTLEKSMDDIIKSIGLLRVTTLLIEIKFEYFDTHIDSKNNSPKKKSISQDNKCIKSSSQNSEKYKNQNIIIIDKSKLIKKNKKDQLYLSINSRKNNSLNAKKTKKEIISYSQNSKSFAKDIKQNKLELDIHLQKDKFGRIYRYKKKYYCERKNMYVFYCFDQKCKSKANYYVDTMQFEIINEHQINYEQHTYNKNQSRYEKYDKIIKEFKKRKCNDAQIFNKENDQLVKWYN